MVLVGCIFGEGRECWVRKFEILDYEYRFWIMVDLKISGYVLFGA